MVNRIEHFIYGTAARLKRLRANLPAGIEVNPVSGGLVLRETLDADLDMDAAIDRIEALAQAHGVEYDGHGEWLADEPEAGRKGLDILSQRFTKRTGIKPGHGFAFDLPDGRYGHAIYVGSNRIGYVLLDISTLVTDQPASADMVRAAPKRYRQPIFVWHTPFVALALAQNLPLADLPFEVALRCSRGFPEPDVVVELEQRFGVSDTDTPEGYNELLLAMAKAAERLPGLEGYSIWTAHVSRTGVLKITEDYTLHRFEDGIDYPMPWQPVTRDEVMAILMGGADMITVRDQVI